MIIKSEQEMLNFGRNLADRMKDGAVIELIGDVGAGKTTLVRGLAEGLGVQETVTSPSFTISKVYNLPSGGNLIHYDFYRLQEPGIMSEDLIDSLADSRNVVIVEWGDSVDGILPDDRTRIEIRYNDDDTRTVVV